MAAAPVRDFSINVGMPKKRALPVQVRCLYNAWNASSCVDDDYSPSFCMS